MDVIQHRIFNCPDYCISKLYINGYYFSDCIEDTDRNLTQDMDLEEIKKIKVKDLTAIPRGEYEIDMETVSPKYSKIKFYKDFCEGKMPRFVGVKGWTGVLVHPGNKANPDSAGCILPGINSAKGMVTNSVETWKKLYNILKAYHNKNEKIRWIIK